MSPARPVSFRQVSQCGIEAGVTFGWSDIVGSTGASVGIDRFGASAPGTRWPKLGMVFPTWCRQSVRSSKLGHEAPRAPRRRRPRNPLSVNRRTTERRGNPAGPSWRKSGLLELPVSLWW